MRKRWLATVEESKARGASWAVAMRLSAGKKRNAEIALGAEGEGLLRAAAAACGHEYLISKMDAGKPVRITSRNRVWQTEPGKKLAALVGVGAPKPKPKATKAQKAQRQPQRQTTPQPAAEMKELAELKKLLKEILDQLS